MHPVMHQDPAAGVAVLALVVEDSEGGAGHRLLEVGVVEHDVRRFAAELELRRADELGPGMQDLAAGDGAAGEGEHVDVGMAGERRAGLRARCRRRR